MTACIGTPISWLRLETFALAPNDPDIDAHVAACPACKHCLDEIRGDAVALPAFVVPARRPRTRWWVFAVPALAAAVIALIVLRPRPEPELGNVATIKGVGEIVLGVVRERDGVVRDDVTTFATGDRWKVEVTCAADRAAWIDVAVVELGATQPDLPLAPARVACGNKVVVPGAFAITGGKPNRICVRVAADLAPRRALPVAGEPDVACVTVTPER
jgi:hypothetical protein